MGSDDFFHKRKARKASSLKRARARRSPYDTALIVCEGGKTEPNYFKSLRDDLKLNTANVEITGDTGGSAPDNVVEHGLRYYGEYDKVFCVFDKDSHPTYQQAVDRVKCTKKKKDHTIEVISHRCLALSTGYCFIFSTQQDILMVLPGQYVKRL